MAGELVFCAAARQLAIQEQLRGAPPVARVRREVAGREPETVCVISAPPEQLNTAQWLRANCHG